MVAGERRRPAASSTGETVMGSTPNRTTGRDPLLYQRSAHPTNGVTTEIVLSLRHGDADGGRSSTSTRASSLASAWSTPVRRPVVTGRENAVQVANRQGT